MTSQGVQARCHRHTYQDCSTLEKIKKKLPQATLLAEHPALMKRPLIVDGDRMHLGWDAATRDALGVDG